MLVTYDQIKNLSYLTTLTIWMFKALMIFSDIEDCYSVLEVDRDCTDDEVKSAYLTKAKAYHPDANAPTSDPYKFSQVKDAYKAVLVSFS